MTELSPAAQAIMVAATNGNFNVVNDPVYKQCIAAALRAAADQVITDHRLASLNSERNAESRLFLIYVREQFRFIAAELEGIKYGTYRCDLKDK